MKDIKNILVSLLILSLTGYAAWFTYNQILSDHEQLAKDSQETQKILQEARDYQATIKPEIEALEKDVKQLQDEFTASFGSNFSGITESASYGKKKYFDSQYTQAEKFYAKCLAALSNADHLSQDEIQFECLGLVTAEYPTADYTRIIDHMTIF